MHIPVAICVPGHLQGYYRTCTAGGQQLLDGGGSACCPDMIGHGTAARQQLTTNRRATQPPAEQPAKPCVTSGQVIPCHAVWHFLLKRFANLAMTPCMLLCSVPCSWAGSRACTRPVRSCQCSRQARCCCTSCRHTAGPTRPSSGHPWGKLYR